MPTWETATEWDAAQSETGVHHEQPANTDWAASDKVEKGHASSDEGGSALEAYYPFDEDSGTTANDVANSRDGTISGATVGNTGGPFGNDYYSFDGTDDLIDVPTSVFTACETADAFTITAWVYVNSAGDGSDGAVFGDWTNEFLIWYDSGGTKNYRIIKQSGNNISTSATASMGYSADTWQHLAATWDGSTDTVEIFLNGSSGDSASGTASLDSVDNPAIGADTDGGGREFDGNMADIRVYARVLSASEISDLYQAAL